MFRSLVEWWLEYLTAWDRPNLIISLSDGHGFLSRLQEYGIQVIPSCTDQADTFMHRSGTRKFSNCKLSAVKKLKRINGLQSENLAKSRILFGEHCVTKSCLHSQYNSRCFLGLIYKRIYSLSEGPFSILEHKNQFLKNSS
jgi:hypothetical protein